MLARDLKLLLAFELVLWLAYGLSKAVLGRWHLALVPVFVVLAPVALRGAIILATFGLAWIHRSPRAAADTLGWRAALALFLREWQAMIEMFVVVQPFERTFVGPDRAWAGAAGAPPVVLVHGYTCNRGAWWWLKPRLEALGLGVATLNLEPAYGDIDLYADALARRIAEVCAESGAPKVALVGHSMGGLVIRACLRRHGAERVARVVTLGTPHQGSRLARLGLGRNARQMEPGNAWLAELARTPPPAELPFLAIWGVHDNYVMPQANAAFPGAASLPLAGVGHLEMMRSDRVLAELGRALRPA